MKGRKPHLAAAREAADEAGITGRVAKKPVGSYGYIKRLKNGAPLECRVQVFPLKVERQRKSWPERHERDLRWFTVAEAAEAVDEPELRELIGAFSAATGRESKKGRPDEEPPAELASQPA